MRLPESITQTPNFIGLLEAVKGTPGGEFIVPHVAEGPFSVLVVSPPERHTHWLVEQVLGALPHHEVRWFSSMEDHTDAWMLVASKYLTRLLEWYVDEEFTIHSDVPPFEALPTEADIAALLPGVYFGTSEDAATESCRRLTEAGHLERLLAILNAAASEDLYDIQDDGPEAVDGYFAAIEAAQLA